MSNVTFVQQSGCAQLYYAQVDGAPFPLVVYLLPQGVTGLASFDLPASWSGNAYSTGCYFLLDTPVAPGSEATFANNAWTFLKMPGRAGARFAWISNPNDTAQPLQGTSMAVQTPGGTAQTSGVTLFNFRNLALVVGPNCHIAVQSDGFQITAPASAPNAIYLQTQWGQTNLEVVDSAGITLPFGGAQSGCLQFTANVEKSTDLVPLDVGLRLFYQLSDGSEAELGDSDPIWLTAMRYPVYQEVQGTLALYANLDVLDQQNPDRTFFGLCPTDGSAPTAHASNYCTNLGQKVSLTPQTGARLVFAPFPVTSQPSEGDGFYLVPLGDFGVSLPGNAANAPCTLMCGVSGVEYVKTQALSFVQSQPAYVAGFQPSTGSAAAQLSFDSLSGQATTSWAFAPSSLYCAQPDDSVLHTTGTGGMAGFMAYMEVPAATLPATAPTTNPAFPMFPYYNNGQPLDDLASSQLLELQLISPSRRQAVYHMAKTTTAAASLQSSVTPAWGITPQGLAAQTAGATWPQVILAQDMNANQVTLNNVQDQGNYPLLSALTSNQLFLVISDKNAVQSVLSGGKVTLKGTADGTPGENWTFDLSPDGWDKYQTILVFKFYGKKLQDLVTDPDTWSHASAFNQKPDQISQALQQLLQNTEDPSLVTAATQESWNGILAFNVPIAQLPNDLSGLMAGIDPALFFCHHLGINVTPATLDKNGNPALQTTSMFGLVHYQVPSLVNNGQDYAFQVESLKALFQNSAITQFASTVQLQVNKLFGDAVTGPNNNIIDLIGVLVNGGYAYTTQGGVSFAAGKNSVFNAVNLDKGQFITVDPDGTLSRFLFWGSLDFRALPAGETTFDLFSFGTDGSGGSGGLSFANLYIDMASAEADQSTFTFDASHMSFDLSSSRMRDSSLYNHFPLTLTSFTQANSGMTPASMGYMSVTNPLGQATMAFPWFALNFDLNLGSFGALAGEAGFVASLMAAWTPSSTAVSTFVGLQLPGSTGGNQREINIENVLKLTFKNITLSVATADDGGPAYTLTFLNAALKLFSVSFPPSGQINIYLFGNPGAGGPSLGWYAGYLKDGAGSSTKKEGA
jgi:hypothetical protein